MKQRLEQTIAERPLGAFFVLSYVLFFIALLVIGGLLSALGGVSDIAMGLMVAIAAWTPNLGAVMVVSVLEGRDGVRRLFSGWRRWRVNWGWYLFVLMPLLAPLASGIGHKLLGGSPPDGAAGLAAPGLVSMVLFHLIQGATGEELGWRGFALPRLQARHSALASAIILGVLVSGWHTILHLISPPGVPEWQFWLVMVCYSIIITWAYNSSQGSLVIVTLFHWAANLGLELATQGLGLIPIGVLFNILTVEYVVAAVLVTVLAGPKHLSRQDRMTAEVV